MKLGLIILSFLTTGLLLTSTASAVTNNAVSIKLVNTDYCITDNKGIVSAGNPIDLEKCNGSASQKFSGLTGPSWYFGTDKAGISLCIGNASKKGKAVLLNCASPNVLYKWVKVGNKGAGGMKYPGGYLDAPHAGQLIFRNNSKVNGREDFIGVQ